MKLSVVLPLLLPDKWSIAMTEFAIKALYERAASPFELVIVETGSRHFESWARDKRTVQRPITHIYVPERSTFVDDWNRGADCARGDLLVHTGNDIFPVHGAWDLALIEPFEKFGDCGMSSISILEAGAPPIGYESPVQGLIAEGWMTAFCAFSSKRRFDPRYKAAYSDSDLVMQVYADGARAYRNYGAVAYHLRGATWNAITDDGNRANFAEGEKLFYERWAGSPLWAFSMLREGSVQWSREHIAAVRPFQPKT